MFSYNNLLLFPSLKFEVIVGDGDGDGDAGGGLTQDEGWQSRPLNQDPLKSKNVIFAILGVFDQGVITTYITLGNLIKTYFCQIIVKNGPIPASFFVYFRYFLDTISIIHIEKSVDGVLGIRTRGRGMVGADETTELWRPQSLTLFLTYIRKTLVPD